MKKIFVLLGHPNSESFIGSLAGSYEAGALEAGHEVRRQNIGDMQFDPVLHKGYKEIQTLEPDLLTFQRNVIWADHIVILYPNWWCTMPALLKGVFDRAWLPGFAFKFNKNKIGWKKLLKGKTGRIIIGAATPWLTTHVLFGDFTNELSRATLGFAGIKTKITIFAPSETTSDTLHGKWMKKTNRLGAKGV